MARPERNDVDYFPHPVTHGKKMYYLDQNYQNDGYRVWFQTLEELGRTSYHYLDFNDESQLMYMSSKCHVSEERYIEIIEVLIRFKEFDKKLWSEHKILWNQKYVDSIKEAYKKRINDCITLEGLYSKLEFPAPETHKQPVNPAPETHKEGEFPEEKGSGNPQSKVKKSKEEKRRVNKKEGKTPPPSFDEFKTYAKTKKPMVDVLLLRLKYESWIENQWRDGHNNQITNWKSKLLNTLPYIPNGTMGQNKQSGVRKDYGIPSPSAIPMPEDLKKRLSKIGQEP